MARIRRDRGGSWLVSFPAVPGAHTYGRSLSELRRRIPELLKLWDYDPSRTEVIEVVLLPQDLRKAIDRALRERKDLEMRRRRSQRTMQDMIKRLQSQLGVGVRDSGELLGISSQYAHKLRGADRRRSTARSRSR